MIKLILGDCLKRMAELEAESVDAIVTDPPYGLSFMGKNWDHGIPGEPFWREALRVAKPGAQLLAFGGTRTYHRLVCAIEDAGWEIRDTIMWVYGSGFPKSLNIGKAVDMLQGIERVKIEKPKSEQRPNADKVRAEKGKVGKFGMSNNKYTTKGTSKWEGFGTALKPAHEPIVLARKPLAGTVAENVLKYGTGGLNIEQCRVGTEPRLYKGMSANKPEVGTFRDDNWVPKDIEVSVIGRFPANLIHDGSDEVVGLFPVTGVSAGARFFYTAKSSRQDRNEGCEALGGNKHCTVKPTSLMRYLCKLITPPKGVILDPFMGSGSTGKAAVKEGFGFIGIELEAEYLEIANARINHAKKSRGLLNCMEVEGE